MGSSQSSLHPGSVSERKPWPFVVALFLVLITALSVQFHLARQRPLTAFLDDGEPESHILVTDIAYTQTDWRVHHFLPIFTLGGSWNKFIDDHPGAESPDALGNFYYTSTPPLTFVAPYFAIRIVGAVPSIVSLRSYNILLGILAAACLGFFTFLCARARGAERHLAAVVAFIAAMVYIAAPETLKSHTIALWAQQFYCVVLLLELLVLFFRPRLFLLGLLAFVACLADWTPYVAHAGMVVLCLYAWRKGRDRKALHAAFVLALATLLAGGCMLLWFHSKMSLPDYFHDLRHRSGVRAGSFSANRFFPMEYLNSFGLFTLLGLAALLCKPWQRTQTGQFGQRFLPFVDPFLAAILIFGIALVENLLMQNHALYYSYDRLKAVQLLALLIAWGAVTSFRRSILFFSGATVLSFASIALFYITFLTPRGYSYMVHSQQERIGTLIRNTASQDGPAFFSGGGVRGSDVFYAGRDIVQSVKEFSADDHLTPIEYTRRWCQQHGYPQGTLYEISGTYPFVLRVDFPRTVHIQRVFTYGTVQDMGTVTLQEQPDDYHDWRPLSSWRFNPIFQPKGGRMQLH